MRRRRRRAGHERALPRDGPALHLVLEAASACTVTRTAWARSRCAVGVAPRALAMPSARAICHAAPASRIRWSLFTVVLHAGASCAASDDAGKEQSDGTAKEQSDGTAKEQSDGTAKEQSDGTAKERSGDAGGPAPGRRERRRLTRARTGSG
ncbi:hypothetical protein [Sorangium sp. So ce1182]|uniref:hypothetical protein n=1 Tax=Sorangium sp. So ce1182 TaxID=3133334 RepID=UPI003F5E9098